MRVRLQAADGCGPLRVESGRGAAAKERAFGGGSNSRQKVLAGDHFGCASKLVSPLSITSQARRVRANTAT